MPITKLIYKTKLQKQFFDSNIKLFIMIKIYFQHQNKCIVYASHCKCAVCVKQIIAAECSTCQVWNK